MRVKSLRVKARVKIYMQVFCVDFMWKFAILHAIYGRVRAAMPVACTVGGQCLGIKQNMHSKSYISLYKLYKGKKRQKKKNNNNNDNNKTMPRLTGIQQEGVLHAHVCMRWATIAWVHQIWWQEIKNSRKVTVLSKAILLVFRISYFDKNRTFSKQDFSAVGFLDLLKTLKTQGQKSLFPY